MSAFLQDITVRVVFAGTPDFAVPCLKAACDKAEVVAVYTQPDRPAGRGRGLMPSPVKAEAIKRGIPVYQPVDFKSAESREILRSHNADLMIVVAYGLILPQKVLDMFPDGCWNVRASMLPRWRGAAPIQRAIQAGDKETGVCLMQMEKGLDTGPVLLSVPVVIHRHETGGMLHDKLAEWGAQVVTDGLIMLRAGLNLPAVPQSSEGVTYAHKLEKQEAIIDWSRPAKDIHNLVRAFNPWPVAEMKLAGERLRIYESVELTYEGPEAPGTLIGISRDGLDIRCGQGALRLVKIQRDGGKPMLVSDYINSHPQLRQSVH